MILCSDRLNSMAWMDMMALCILGLAVSTEERLYVEENSARTKR